MHRASQLVVLLLLSSCLVTTDEDAWIDGAIQPDVGQIDQQAGDGNGNEAAPDGPVVVDSSVDGPMADGPAADGPAPDTSPPDGPTPDGPAADGPAPDTSPPDGPTPDGPTPDNLAPDTSPVDLPANAEGNLPQGSPCLASSQCQSGHCRDGFCCDTSCAAPCVACNLAGKEGTCSPAPAGTDPDSDCIQDPVSTCSLDGTCDGTGGCRTYPTGTVCAKTCTAVDRSAVSTCTSGACVAGLDTDCAPFACDSATGACFSACSGDAQCTRYRCDTTTSQCYTKCTTAAECQTGFKCNPQGKCI